MTKVILTHVAPDFDAIGYAWLMIKFAPGFKDARITYTSVSTPGHDLLNRADSVGDIGGEYDPERRRFDHHHLPGSESTATCATRMVWEWLGEQGIDLEYLAPLIEVIYQGDIGHIDPVGIHSQMGGWKICNKDAGRILTDNDVMGYGIRILTMNELWLRRQSENAAELEEKVVYKSDDGLLWVIRHGSIGSSFAAYDQGARLVAFEAKPIELADGSTTYPVGISRAPEWKTPHIGQIVKQAIAMGQPSHRKMAEELETWFNHPAGFFSGRGTAKAPCPDSLKVDIVDLAKRINMSWKR